MSWKTALDERARRIGSECWDRLTTSPPSILWDGPAGNRSFSIRRRFVPISQHHRAIRVVFWTSDGEGRRPCLEYEYPLEPSDTQQAADLFDAADGWLAGHLQSIDVQASLGEGLAFEPEATPLSSRQQPIHIESTPQGWRLYIEQHNLCRHRTITDRLSHDTLDAGLLHQICTWLLREWNTLVLGLDARPPEIAQGVVSACKAYARLPVETKQAQLWYARHASRAAAAEGPNLFIERQGDDIVFSWDSHASADRVFEVGHGTAVIPVIRCIESLRELVGSVTGKHPPTDPEAVFKFLGESLSDGAEVDASWFGKLGFDRDTARAYAAVGYSRHPLVGLLRTARSVRSVKITPEDIQLIFRLLEPATPDGYAKLGALAEGLDTSIDPSEPWDSGYMLASQIRHRLSLAPVAFLDVDSLAESLGIRVHEVALTDQTVRGACIATSLPVVRFSPFAGGPLRQHRAGRSIR